MAGLEGAKTEYKLVQGHHLSTDFDWGIAVNKDGTLPLTQTGRGQRKYGVFI